MKTTSMLGLSAALSISLAQFALSTAFADDRAPAALTGEVTSDAEGVMEGVVVTAHKDGSIVSVSVTTDARGWYAFPESKLVPGEYKITIRAVGYDISVPTTADVVAEKTATADIKLKKTRNLASQLSNAEWMMSIPGAEEQKATLLDCTGCHTLERIVRSTHDADEWTQVSTHDADEWTQVITRMKGYAFVSTPLKPQRMLDETRAGKPEDYRKMAEYLATINLSAVDKWDYPLKTLPRPSGRATRAAVTEYDMKRPTTQPQPLGDHLAGAPDRNQRRRGWLPVATINLSAVDKWDYPLKTLPRPSGRATRAAVTEYDMKRPTTQPQPLGDHLAGAPDRNQRRRGWLPVEGRDLSSRQTKYLVRDLEIGEAWAARPRIYDCSGMSSGPSNQKTTYYQ